MIRHEEQEAGDDDPVDPLHETVKKIGRSVMSEFIHDPFIDDLTAAVWDEDFGYYPTQTNRGHMSVYHHTLFTRAAWESHESTKALRNNCWLIPPIDPETEKQLHRDIAVVPLLDPVTALHVKNDFEPVEGDFICSMLSFIKSVNRAINHPKSSYLQRALGSLTTQGVELQIPYVQDGLLVSAKDHYFKRGVA